MSILTKETPPQLDRNKYKFVRYQNRVAFNDPSVYHKNIAIQDGVFSDTTPKAYGIMVILTPRVSDGGMFFIMREEGHIRMELAGSTMSCFIEGDPIKAREESLKVFADITGLNIRANTRFYM